MNILILSDLAVGYEHEHRSGKIPRQIGIRRHKADQHHAYNHCVHKISAKKNVFWYIKVTALVMLDAVAVTKLDKRREQGSILALGVPRHTSYKTARVRPASAEVQVRR